jgi:hypothetical protein
MRENIYQFLDKHRVEYFEGKDGTILVPGNLSLRGLKLEQLPDLSRVVVARDFDCSDNLLASLSGAPQVVGGNFRCSINQLENLSGGPRFVGGNYECIRNRLTTLRGVADEVGGKLWCVANRLVLLDCVPSKLESLETDAETDRVKINKRPNPRRQHETIARLLREKELDGIGDNIALEAGIKVRKPINLKRRHSFAR